MQVNLLYCPRIAETKNRLQEVVRNSFPQHTLNCINATTTEIPRNVNKDNTIFYGVGDDWDLTKKTFLQFVADIVPNTMVNQRDLGEYDPVVVKESDRRTIICLNKDGGTNQRYKFVERKSEFRVNFSYGIVNVCLNKNLANGQPFGKVGDNSHWSVEQDATVRQHLTRLTKQIGQRIAERFPKVLHFGIDFIRDEDTGTYYILELNRANSRNEENCKWLFEHFLANHERSSFEPVRTNLFSRITSARNMDEVRAAAREILNLQ